MPESRTLPFSLLVALLMVAVNPATAAGASEGRTDHPSVKATSFSVADPLPVARNNHIAALLPGGMVLVAGGFDGTNVLASAVTYMPYYAGFAPFGTMSVPRQNAAAVVLPDGRVLIVGGNDGTGPLDSAEIYEPGSGFRLIADTMSTTRNSPTATLLGDGSVLIAGGIHPTAIATAEIWDPATEQFTMTSGPMGSPRVGHTATLLPDGDVLIAGGSDNTTRFATAEIYDHSTRTFTALTRQMASGRFLHTATLLPNDRVLITGGLSASGAVSHAELYNPATETFTVTGAMAAPRFFHTATLLPDGRVLVDGAQSAPEIYNPATGTFSTTGDAAAVRYNATATLMPTGAVLIVGGSTGSAPVDTVLFFLVDIKGIVTQSSSSMLGPRIGSTATLLPDGRVLLAGGGPTPQISAELYDPVADSFTSTGQMTVARKYHTATALADGKVLLTGGSQGGEAETYDPSSATFTATASPMAVARTRHSATLLRDGTVLIAGGGTTRAEIYDPLTRRFTEVGPAAWPRVDHEATLLYDGKVLITGGTVGGEATATVELFNPATRTFQMEPAMAVPRAAHTATLLLNGFVLVAGGDYSNIYGQFIASSTEYYVPGLGFLDYSPSLLAPRAGHRATLLTNGQLLIAGGYDSSGPLATTELFDLSWSNFVGGPLLSVPHSEPTVVRLADGRVFIGTGASTSGYTSVVDLYRSAPGFPDSRRPVVSSFTHPLCLPGNLAVAGISFQSDSEGSNGRAPANNQPQLRLERVDGMPQTWITPESSSDSSFFSRPFSHLPSGPYRLAIVSNGVPAVEKLIDIETTPVLATYPEASATLGDSISVLPASTPLAFNGSLYPQRASASGGFAGTLWVSGASGEVNISEAGPVGTYTITVASSNACGSASTAFTLKVLGPPTSLVASGGTPQSAAINTLFATPLRVTVTDSAGHPLENVSVAFTAPATGATATFSPASSALTNASGMASVNATANGVMGAYSVVATVGGLTATFALTNVPATPTGTNALATTSTSVSLTWTGTAGATYQVARVSASGLTTLGTSLTGAYVDNTALAGTAYLYKVRATAPFVTAYGAPDLATTVIFTDPTLTAGSTPIKAAHITQLRTAVNAVRALAGLTAGTYTDPVITATVTSAKAAHITDLRTALGAARAALSLPTVTFLRPSLAGLPIQTTEIVELRNGVK